MSAGFRLWQLVTNTFLLSSFKPVLACSKTHFDNLLSEKAVTHSARTEKFVGFLKVARTESVLGREGDNFPNFSVAVEHVQVFRIQCRGYAS